MARVYLPLFFFFFTRAKGDFLGAWSLPLWRGMEGWKLPRAADFMKVGETLASFIGGKEYKKEKTKQNKTSCVGQAQLLQRASAGGSRTLSSAPASPGGHQEGTRHCSQECLLLSEKVQPDSTSKIVPCSFAVHRSNSPLFKFCLSQADM